MWKQLWKQWLEINVCEFFPIPGKIGVFFRPLQVDMVTYPIHERNKNRAIIFSLPHFFSSSVCNLLIEYEYSEKYKLRS
jgi:hypothetical protein